MGTLPLRAALTRGALVTAANWPIVLIDFVLESFYKLAVAVPVVGGALMVAAISGADLRTLVGGGVLPTSDLVISALGSAPVALTTFFGAVAIVALGGEVLMFVVKAGTLAVLVAGERDAGRLSETPLDLDALREASAYRLERVLAGMQRFGRRALWLALALGVIYFIVGVSYFTAVSYGFALAVRSTWAAAWPLIVLVSTSVGVVTIAGVNLGYDLLRVIVVTDDCDIPTALSRLRGFAIEDARQVIGIFSVIGSVMFFATVAAILAAAGLTLVAWVPVIGLLIVPLQAAAWVLRGLLFQYVSLAALSAYQTQYRRFAETRWDTDAPRS